MGSVIPREGRIEEAIVFVSRVGQVTAHHVRHGIPSVYSKTTAHKGKYHSSALPNQDCQSSG